MGYRFEHPNEEEHTVIITGWSYVWAGLFGAFYVALKGHPRQFPKALLVNLAYLVPYVLLVGASSQLAPNAQLTAVVLSVPVILILQSLAMVRLVRDGYRRRGWWIQRA